MLTRVGIETDHIDILIGDVFTIYQREVLDILRGDIMLVAAGRLKIRCWAGWLTCSAGVFSLLDTTTATHPCT